MTTTSTINSITTFSNRATWLNYFNVRQAIEAVRHHIATLPSSQTEEKHTARVYSDGLGYFLRWADNDCPTEQLLNEFVAHLIEKGLKPSTIGSKYLAPVRLFIKKLASQHIPVTGVEREFVSDIKESLRAAAEVKTPRKQTTSNISPLWKPEYVRLTSKQVNALLRQIDTTTIKGKRDYAFMLIAFSSALRIAELHRLTLANITREGDVSLVIVRGKRSNVDPVPVAHNVVNAIRAYVDAYNAKLSADDPRRITNYTALWQPIQHGDNHPILGVNGFHPTKGMSQQALRDIIASRSSALGADCKMAAHDTRRTAAAMAYDAGMPLTDIQALLRHKEAGITLKYVGTKPTYDTRTLANYVTLG